MNAFILAAGLGTRLRPLTDKITKPAVPFFNVPLLYHSFFILKKLGVEHVVVNTHHIPKQIEDLSNLTNDFEINFSNEQPNVLGTGGGLKNAQKYFKNKKDILILNGDNLFLDLDIETLKKSIDYHLQNKFISTLLTTEHPLVGTKFGGVWVDENKKVISIGKERPQKYKYGYHYIGLQIVSKNIFDFLPDGFSHLWKDGLNPALKKGKAVFCANINCDWQEAGDEAGFLEATTRVFDKKNQGRLGSYFSELIKTYSPDSNFVQNNFIGKNFKLEKEAHIDGHCVIGDNVTVGQHSKLENVVILNNVPVPANSLIKNKIIY